MAKARWSFTKLPPRCVKRDPFEAEFFTGEEDTEEVYGRTDALVREAIQNSLDAHDPAQHPFVRVRFAISSAEQELSPTAAKPYLAGLLPHLDVLKNDVVSSRRPQPKMRFLVYEDFNTFGLCGNPGRTEDPPPGHTDREDFYWFWWNIGRSGKSGADRGRWGLGKTVFPSTSQINSLFGLTVRATDRKRMLMGQTITRTHRIGIDEYPPEGFYHDVDDPGPVQMPLEDKAELETFAKHFSLQRGSLPGLSIVVPFCFDALKASEILRSVIVHYFAPILRGQLVVEVAGPDLEEVRVARQTIREVALNLRWKGSKNEKKHAHPPFDLAEWAIEQEETGIEAELSLAGVFTVPEWSEERFSTALLTKLRDRFAKHERVAIRVPMTLELKGAGKAETFFDLFLEHDDGLQRGEDYFVREGMTIAGINTMGSFRGIRGMVFVNDKTLSSMLGDAEGPAHNDWSTGETRPDRQYVKWKRRVSFVKNSLIKTIGILTPPPEGLDENLLEDIFSLEDYSKAGTKKKRKPKVPGPVPPPVTPVLPQPPRWYRVIQRAGGFQVKRSGEGEVPSVPLIRLAVAYDLPAGSPLKNHSPFDFELTPNKSNPVRHEATGADVMITGPNRMMVAVKDSEFTVNVFGFDPIRDLYISITEEGNEG